MTGSNQKKKLKGKNKEPRKFLFFDRLEMQMAISLFLASSRKTHYK